MLSKETIYTLYNVEGLLLLGSFIIGYNNNEWWLSAAFYVLLPLVAILFIISAISLPREKDPVEHAAIKRFYYFNLAILVGLIIFVFWALGGFNA